MTRLIVVVAALLASLTALGADPGRGRSIDLRTPQALEQLQRENPAHFAKIEQIVEGLRREPERAESDWLQVNFDARDVGLSRSLIKTSDPPKQILSFRLDEVRYTLYVTRTDLTPMVMPAK
jgi:hypothetical protein